MSVRWVAELFPVRQSFAKAYFPTCDRAGVKQGIKASRREVFRIGCNSEAGTCLVHFLADLASLSIFYEIGQDGWPVMAWPCLLIRQRILCPAWYDPHSLFHHGLETTFFIFGFLLTHTPEEQSVLSTPIQYSVNKSIIQSLLFYWPGSFFRRIGQVPDERLLSIILPDIFWLHYVTFLEYCWNRPFFVCSVVRLGNHLKRRSQLGQ